MITKKTFLNKINFKKKLQNQINFKINKKI